MYNIHSHYETIFGHLKSIVAHRRLFYLLPYGSTQPENLEALTDNLKELHINLWAAGRAPDSRESPFFVFYDQEPIYGEFNIHLLDHIRDNFLGPYILVTTEKDSDPLDKIKENYGWPTVYYFHHAFAAHDWFRGYRYSADLIAPDQRKLTKKYISFNRLTSGPRVYRTLLINELIKQDILNDGHVSYNDSCPEGGTYQENLEQAVGKKLITQDLANEAVNNISSIQLPLRVDYQNEQYIPNHSFVLSAVKETQESFCYLVTETCYWERKCHLTEKIFKPIISQMPFVLVGPAHNLKYLREYGFKTFSPWIDESYDDIEDPILRMQAISRTMKDICNHSVSELEDMLKEMQPVLKHNYDRFYDNAFLDYCWDELLTNIKAAVDPNEFGSTHAHV